MTAARLVRLRRGFTLLELMLALTLTAIAAGVAGASIVAARRTGERVDAHKADGEAEARLRAVLTDMLRHAPAADRTSEPLLQLQRGETGTVLTFLTTGVQLPLGTGPVWRATLMVDNSGLRLDAAPVRGGVGGVPITMQLPGIHTLEVDVLEAARAGELAQWRSDWPLAQTRPTAIAVRWQRSAETATPLVTALDPLGAGQVVP